MICLSSDHPVEVVDFGPETVGGYAVFDVESFSPAPGGAPPVLRLSCACHPESIRPEGDFKREEGAYYLHVDNPVLPANPGSHEFYSIPRTGTFVSPLAQGQLRFLRIALETPGAAVALSGVRIATAGVHSEAPVAGSFECSDPGLADVWRLGVRSCQMASITNGDAWRVVEGMLLPRWVERGGGEGWCRFEPDFEGTLEIDVEFRRNPHFGGPAFFEVFTGRRDGEPAASARIVQEGLDGEIRTARIPLKPGRFGFRLEKEQWPVIHEVRVLDESGILRWRDDFKTLVQRRGEESFAQSAQSSQREPRAKTSRTLRPLREEKSGVARNWVYPSAPPHLADGGKRDRLVWSGDLWWSQRTAYCAFGPGDPHVAGALRILAFNQTPEGFIHAAPYATASAPPRSGDFGLFASDEFSAWFVPVLWAHLLHTGDYALARELWPAADRDLRYLATRMGPDGLHEPHFETSKHAYAMECGDLSKRAYQNLVFWMAWRDGARLARALGHAARAAELEALAASHAAAIRKLFCTPAETPGISWNTILGEPGIDPLSGAMLLASGLLSDAEAAALAAACRECGTGKFRVLRIIGLFRHGLADEAMRTFEEGNWRALADPAWPGAHCTTECLYLYTHGWWDESHPDTSVCGVFQDCILGVEPLEPGYRVFRVDPRPPSGISWARGRVPTPCGDIEVAWKRTAEGISLSVAAPPGTRAVRATES